MFIKLIVDDITAGFTELRRPRGLLKYEADGRYFLRKGTLISNAIIFTKFELKYMSEEIQFVNIYKLNLNARKRPLF